MTKIKGVCVQEWLIMKCNNHNRQAPDPKALI